MPEYVGILKTITGAINTQIEIQKDRASAAESTARQLLDQVAHAATELSDNATRDAISGATQAERLRIGRGLIVTALFLGIALFASRDRRPADAAYRRRADAARARDNRRRAFPYLTRGDEIGDTARAASVFKDNLLQMAGSRPSKTAPRRGPASARAVGNGATRRYFEKRSAKSSTPSLPRRRNSKRLGTRP